MGIFKRIGRCKNNPAKETEYEPKNTEVIDFKGCKDYISRDTAIAAHKVMKSLPSSILYADSAYNAMGESIITYVDMVNTIRDSRYLRYSLWKVQQWLNSKRYVVEVFPNGVTNTYEYRLHTPKSVAFQFHFKTAVEALDEGLKDALNRYLADNRLIIISSNGHIAF